MNGLALCAGVAGLELGLKLLFGDAYRVVCYVEREAFDAAALVARMEDEALDRAPVWDDLTTFDGRAWRGLVDIFTAGFPCQPWSQAGQRKGREDARWLWPSIFKLIRVVRPRVVFLENVAGLLRVGTDDNKLLVEAGLGHVLRDLAGLGFDAEWGVFTADSFGAPHERKRVFILAYARERGRMRHERRADGILAPHGSLQTVAHADGREPRPRPRKARRGSAAPPGHEEADRPAHSSKELANASSFSGDGGLRARWQPDAHGAREEVAHADGNPSGEGRAEQPRLVGRASAHSASYQVGDAQPFPPGRDDLEGWLEYLEVHPGLEPSVCRGADGLAYRLDGIAATGNGVVPVVAAYAYATLARRFGDEF